MVYHRREIRIRPEEMMEWFEQEASCEQHVIFFLVFNLKKLKINLPEKFVNINLY